MGGAGAVQDRSQPIGKLGVRRLAVWPLGGWPSASGRGYRLGGRAVTGGAGGLTANGRLAGCWLGCWQGLAGPLASYTATLQKAAKASSQPGRPGRPASKQRQAAPSGVVRCTSWTWLAGTWLATVGCLAMLVVRRG
jgi:hypothetical protein